VERLRHARCTRELFSTHDQSVMDCLVSIRQHPWRQRKLPVGAILQLSRDLAVQRHTGRNDSREERRRDQHEQRALKRQH